MAAITAGGSGRQTCCGSGQPAGLPDHDAGVSELVPALLDALTAAAQLAARFRARATVSREPAAYARAAAITGAVQTLGQAWQLICDPVPAPDGQAGPEEAVQLLAGARLLGGAVSALADRTAVAARHAAQPPADRLTGVLVCLRAARQQISDALEPAGIPGSRSQPPAGDPPHEPGPQQHLQAPAS